MDIQEVKSRMTFLGESLLKLAEGLSDEGRFLRSEEQRLYSLTLDFIFSDVLTDLRIDYGLQAGVQAKETFIDRLRQAFQS